MDFESNDLISQVAVSQIVFFHLELLTNHVQILPTAVTTSSFRPIDESVEIVSRFLSQKNANILMLILSFADISVLIPLK
jgi:hypothetical protein